MEVIQCLELIFSAYESDTHQIFFKHQHCELILRTILSNLQLTAQLIPQLDKRPAFEAELFYEHIFGQITQVNEFVVSLMQT